MSSQQSSLEREILALRQENYNVGIVNGLLIVRDIPYVTNTRSIKRGVLAFPVEETPEGLVPTGDHTSYFFGEHPCDVNGNPLKILAGGAVDFDIPGTGRAKLRLSRKKNSPSTGPTPYTNAREKLETYVSIISSSAIHLDGTISAKTGGVPPELNPVGPFLYPDSASTRVGIGHLNAIFENQRIGIIGLGGTGSYILDLVAKTHVPEIHLFDADRFRAHNAFRAPGASSPNEVESGELKADRFCRIYSAFRKGIIAHILAVTFETRSLLETLDFVFLAVDNNEARYDITELLIDLSIPFVDVGMSANIVQEPTSSLIARIRTTYWNPGSPAPFLQKPSSFGADMDDYVSNIQIAELNSINAAFAVIRWKKHLGYYQDCEGEDMSIYDTNVQTLAKP